MIKRPYKLLSILLILSMTLVMAPAVLWAMTDIPPAPGPPIYVQDYAGLLDEQTKSNIINLGTQIEKRSGAQVVVVTVDKLGASDIREYANELFRKWGIGDKEKDNGILLLVNKENLLTGKSGKVRIEVGYGLEGAIPDGKAGRILDNYVLPRWQAGDYRGGIWQGYMAIGAEIAREYNFKLDQQYVPKPVSRGSNGSGGDPLIGFIVFLVIFAVLSAVFRKGRRRRGDDDYWGGGFGGWGGFGGFGGGSGGFGDGGGFGGGSSGGGGADR